MGLEVLCEIMQQKQSNHIHTKRTLDGPKPMAHSGINRDNGYIIVLMMKQEKRYIFKKHIKLNLVLSVL